MAGPAHRLLAFAVFLGAVQLAVGYGYKNCIDPDSKRENFQCIRKKGMDIFAFVGDLPASAINLTISNNPLWKIPNNSFVVLPRLQHLRLDHNKLTVIEGSAFQNLHQLMFLNLSFNNIHKLNPSLFDDLRNLTYLSLTNNRLKQLPENIFSNVPRLETLIMRQNNLTNFSGIVESVHRLPRLKTLDLCFNHLTSLFHSNVSLPESLTTLYMCRNKLSALSCSPRFLSMIRVLDLSYNIGLKETAFQGVDLKRVNYLRMRSTNVSLVKFLKLSNITASHVDFTDTLKNGSGLVDLCQLLKKRMNVISSMSLSSNGIKNLANALSKCPKITGVLDLSRNDLKVRSCLAFLHGQADIKRFIAEHNHLTKLLSCKKNKTVYFTKLEEVSYRYNRILFVNSNAFWNTPNIKVLKLNINTIAYLDRKAFKGLRKLETLRLDNNLLTDLFSSTFEDQCSLQTLNLRNNRISAIFNGTFRNLGNLTTLDLGGNKIAHFQPSGLDGLKKLSKFYLDGNNLKQIDSSLYHVFQDTLTVLDLQRNQICFYVEKVSSPFRNLSKLLDLKIDGQLPHGLALLPRSFFSGLRSLKSLYLTNNRISYLAADAFDDLTGLQFLTLDSCCVGAAQLQPGVFKNLRNLTKLAVENIGIQKFSREVFGNLTNLQKLQINRNVMQSIDVNALEGLPNLKYVDLRNIPLSCTCENNVLQNWSLNNPNVQVVDLYNLHCQDNIQHYFYNFKTDVCYIDFGEYLFFSTALVIFLFTVTPILYVKFYWKMKYYSYVFRSWFSDQWRRISEADENCRYDAFISYNSSDEEWVMEQLLPNLEGKGSGFKLCLHHRDFELGRYIVDNIVSAVYNSRKTICVVSRNFLKSEWCSMEIQMASYRLFDEHRDVLLLIFLDPISERQLSSYHAMRKVMMQKTYLQWPGSDCTNLTEAQELFWNHLRRAMRPGKVIEDV